MSDKEIIGTFKSDKSKTKAFEMLVDAYSERLYWHIRRMVIHHQDANDILQNTYIKIWKNLQNFREDSKLYTWLYRIATNETLTYLNKNKKYATSSIDYQHENEEAKEFNLDNSLKADPYFDGDEAEIKLQKAIQSLPDKQRTVFIMRYYDEVKYSDMSEILQTSEGALKASYHLAVKKIESHIKND